MKKFMNPFLFITLLTGLAIGFNSCSDDEFANDSANLSVNENNEDVFIQKSFQLNKCGEPVEYELIAGQHSVVGKVTIANDEENLYVQYNVWGDGIYLTETHLYVGSIDQLPLNSNGNPVIGQFTYSEDHGSIKTYTFVIPLSEIVEECPVIAAHAVLNNEETAWARGGCSFNEEFGANRWGWFICEYCIQKCSDEPKELIIAAKVYYINDERAGFLATSGYSTSENDWCKYFGYTKFDLADLEILEIDMHALYDTNYLQGSTLIVNKVGDVITVLADITSVAYNSLYTYLFIGTQEELDLLQIGQDCPEYNSFPYSFDGNYIEIPVSDFE